MLPTFQTMEGSIRLQTHTTNSRIQFSKAPRRSNKSATRAQPGDEMGDAARGLVPDFVRGSAVVRLPIRGIAVLIGVKVFVRLGCDNFMDFANGSVRALVRSEEHTSELQS